MNHMQALQLGQRQFAPVILFPHREHGLVRHSSAISVDSFFSGELPSYLTPEQKRQAVEQRGMDEADLLEIAETDVMESE